MLYLCLPSWDLYKLWDFVSISFISLDLGLEEDGTLNFHQSSERFEINIFETGMVSDIGAVSAVIFPIVRWLFLLFSCFLVFSLSFYFFGWPSFLWWPYRQQNKLYSEFFNWRQAWNPWCPPFEITSDIQPFDSLYWVMPTI